MKVTGKIMNGNELVGFELTDNASYRVSPMTLYLKPNIEVLTAEGYIYTDYDPTHIKQPNGESIMNVPDLELDDNTRQAIAMSKRSLVNVLTDAQASRYYSVPENSGEEINFFAWTEGYTVNTREELANYVSQVERVARRNPMGFVVRPFNTIVNPTVWFTPEELLHDMEASQLYRRCMALRKWVNYEHYTMTCNFFASKGLMQADDVSMRSMFNAWYAFGPDLIKGKCVETHINLNVDGEFYNNDSFTVVPKSTLNGSNRVYKDIAAAYNTETGELITSNGMSTNIDSILSLERGNRGPVYMKDNFMNMLKAQHSDYPIVLAHHNNVGVADISDRFYASVVSEGRTYIFKADDLRIQLRYANSALNMECPMEIAASIQGTSVLLRYVPTYDKYIKYNMCQLSAVAYVKSVTEEPISRYNAEYLNKLNMGIIGQIRKYLAMKDMREMSTELMEGWLKHDFVGDALTFYVSPIPAYVLDELGVSEYESVEDFLAKANIDGYLARYMDAVEGDSTEAPRTFMPPEWSAAKKDEAIRRLIASGVEHEPFHYYKLLELVHNIIKGKESYRCLLEGLDKDGAVNVGTATIAILAVVNAIVGADADLQKFTEALNTFHQYVNPKSIYRNRTAAATGYVLDYANDAELMFSENTLMWCYVTRVYRELSNLPVEQQRPYLLEMIAFDKQDATSVKLRDVFMKMVLIALGENSFVPDYDYEQVYATTKGQITNGPDLSKKFAGFLAAKLLFKCLIMVKNGKMPTNVDHVERMSVIDGYDINVIVPATILQVIQGINVENYRKLVTLDYLTLFEVNGYSEGGASQFSIVNAKITPWSVEPLPGYAIKTFPFMQNYYDTTTLITSFGQDKVNALVASKVKAHASIRDVASNPNVMYPVTPMINPNLRRAEDKEANQHEVEMYQMLLNTSTAYHDFDMFLDIGQLETVEVYLKRWNAAKKEAKMQGKTLLSIPLKQDILYKEIGISMGFDIHDEPVYTDDASCGTNFLAENILAAKSCSLKAIETTLNKKVVMPFGARNITCSIVDNYAEILSLPVLNGVVLSGLIFIQGRCVDTAWAEQNFTTLSDGTKVGHFQNGYFILEEV